MAIGNLQVDLTLETGQFSSGINKVQLDVKSLASTVASVGAAFAGGIIAGGALAMLKGLGQVIRGVSQNFEELKNSAFALNQAPAGVLALEQSLEKLGASSSDATKGVQSISELIQDAFFGKASKAAEVMKALGVALVDSAGNARPVTDVIADLAAAYASLPDGMDKARASQVLFGNSAREMQAVLNQGAQAIRDNAAASEASAQSWSTMNSMYQSVIDTVRNGMIAAFQALIPSIQAMSSSMENSSAGFDFFKASVGVVIGALAGFIQIIGSTVSAIGNLVDAANQGGRALGNLAAVFGNFSLGEFKAAGQAWEDFKTRGVGSIDAIKKSFDDLVTLPGKTLGVANEAANSFYNGLAVSQRNLAQSGRELAGVQTQVTTSTQALHQSLIEVDKAAKGGGTKQMRDELAEWSARLMDAIDPTRVFNRELDLLNQAMERGLIPADQYAAAVGKLKEQALGGSKSLTSQFDELNKNIVAFGSNVGDAFIDAIANGKDFGDVLKSLITDLAKMFFRIMVMKPLMNMLFPTGGGGIAGISAPAMRMVVPSSPAVSSANTRAVSPASELRAAPFRSVSGGASSSSSNSGAVNMGDMTINISGAAGGVEGDSQRTRDMAKKIRESVVSVIVDERRPGGLLAGVR